MNKGAVLGLFLTFALLLEVNGADKASINTQLQGQLETLKTLGHHLTGYYSTQEYQAMCEPGYAHRNLGLKRTYRKYMKQMRSETPVAMYYIAKIHESLKAEQFCNFSESSQRLLSDTFTHARTSLNDVLKALTQFNAGAPCDAVGSSLKKDVQAYLKNLEETIRNYIQQLQDIENILVKNNWCIKQ